MNVNAPAYVKNPKLVAWVTEMAALCKPDTVYWCDGSQEEYDRLCQQLVAAGTFKKLNPANAPTLIWLALTPQTWRAWKTAPSFAPPKKKTLAPPTTGWNLPRCVPR